MVNKLEGAELPHFFLKEEPLLFLYSKYFQKILQDIFTDFLKIEQGWNFVANTPAFLDAIQNFVEFVPELLEQLKPRAILPFLSAYGMAGTYAGFAQSCVGLFGDDVVIEYIDATFEINISNISSPINYLFLSEGRDNFNFSTEDGSFNFKTEDIFVPPSGLSTLARILKKFLPAENSEIVTINFSTT